MSGTKTYGVAALARDFDSLESAYTLNAEGILVKGDYARTVLRVVRSRMWFVLLITLNGFLPLGLAKILEHLLGENHPVAEVVPFSFAVLFVIVSIWVMIERSRQKELVRIAGAYRLVETNLNKRGELLMEEPFVRLALRRKPKRGGGKPA